MKIGCDIVENIRLQNKNQRFVDLVLTPREQIEYKERGKTYLYGRFAAKEAIMKILPNTKERDFLEIEIVTNPDGSPKCNIENIEISISHEKDYTIPVALYKE